ncbi:MAG TPA: Ig-like domain repeat protein [Chloroflexi bacterium]|nr:Ig-like domain repeat protein [Chloroflexota bacterium]
MEGMVLEAGERSLLVTFVPNDLITFYTATQRAALVVTKAGLAVRADDKARNYGDPNPPLTVSYGNFVGADGMGDLLTPPTATTTATETTPQGVYAIVPGGGDDANYALTYVDGVLTITAADPQVVLTSSPNPSYYRQPVKFTASFTAGLPSGTVTFYNNGGPGTLVLPGAQVLGTAELINSQATLVTDTLAAGTHYILAVYNGDANNNPSTSAPYEQVVEMPTNVIAAEGSVKMGMVFAYSVVASNPNTTPLYSVVITGSIPAQAAYVSVVGGKWVASGGDYGNGYVTSGVIPELAPGERYTLTWSAQPTAFLADMSTQAHISSINAQADVTLSIRVYRLILPVIYKNATP